MKKIILALVLCVSINTFAQEKMNLTPEQSATLRTKEMTLHLDLTENQQKQVFKLNEEISTKRAETRKVNRKDISDEERYELRLEHLDQMIIVKNEMKDILNEKQFEKWETTMQQRGKKMQRERSEKEHKREKK